MRTNVVSAILIATAFSAGGWAADSVDPVAGQPPVTFSVESPVAASAASKAGEARLARVTGWIRERAPACPPDIMVSAAQRFLEELQERHPEQLDRLLGEDFQVRDVEPALLRQLGALLVGASWTPLREELARRRVEALLGQEGSAAAAATADASSLMARIKGTSQVQYRRLVEGRMDEDDLARLLKKTRGGDTARSATTPEQTKGLTAATIVSEFSRHNQVGSALQRLRAYTVEGRLKTASGEEQHLLLFKMRPDRFRLAVLVDGTTRFIVAGDGQRFWQQAPGQPPQIVAPEKMGTRRYLGEFLEPLFAGEGISYERLADGASDGKKFYRLAVRRADGSSYVAQIDLETFRETGREDIDGSNTRYSDFRQVAGVTIAFREEATDKEGRKGVLELVRVTPNPGLIQDLFDPAAQGGQTYFAVEQFLPRLPPAAANSKPSSK
jgi:hypothetical protein